MKIIPKISDAEWQVMKVLWKKAPLSSSQIIEVLKTNTTWSPKTVHTLIGRLVKKEALKVQKESPLNLYLPLITEAECRRRETRSFLQKVYDGSVHLLIANFIKEESLSPQEVQELKRILDDMEE